MDEKMWEKQIIAIPKDLISIVESIIIVLTTLFICLSMTIASDYWKPFDNLLNCLTLVCIILGVALPIFNKRQVDKRVAVLTLLYFAVRLLSYYLNDLPITYGGTLMLQGFYLIGISKYIYGGTKKEWLAINTFIVFDVCAVLICYYLYCFQHEYVNKFLDVYADKGMSAQTCIFQNPNYAGMMTGAAIIAAIAIAANKSFNKKTLIWISPIIAINLYMLIFDTGCRSAQTGVVGVCLLGIIIGFEKRIDSVKAIIGISLIACFLSLIPLYTLVYWKDNNEYVCDRSAMEWKIEELSSERYAIWKSTILSQEGHELFGFGSSTTAWNKRRELVNNTPPERTSETYLNSASHKRQHNGYLAVYNETGFAGAICLLLLLLSRVRNLKGRFCDGQWEKLLLIYIFWINLFEAKFILHLFFTGFLMMVLLLPPEEEEVEI